MMNLFWDIQRHSPLFWNLFCDSKLKIANRKFLLLTCMIVSQWGIWFTISGKNILLGIHLLRGSTSIISCIMFEIFRLYIKRSNYFNECSRIILWIYLISFLWIEMLTNFVHGKRSRCHVDIWILFVRCSTNRYKLFEFWPESVLTELIKATERK